MLPENQINNNPADDATEIIEVADDEIVEVDDATADGNVAAKLPPRGIFPIKWKAGKDDHPYKAKTKGDTPRAFVGTSLIGSLQDSGSDFDGALVFENHINSLQRRGKPTSDLHHFLNVVGNPAPNRSTIGELLEHAKQTLEAEPIGMAEIDWKASYKDGDTWKDITKTMTGFPKHMVDGKWDGTYEQEIPNPKDGEPVGAQLYVRKHLTQAEAQKLKAKATA